MTQTTLAAAVAATDTSITVASTLDFPASPVRVAINGEEMLVPEPSGTTWAVQRDQAEPSAVVAADRFLREEVGSFGNSDDGINWKDDVANATVDVTVTGGNAIVEILAAAEQLTPRLGIVDPLNSEVRFRFKINALSVAGDLDVMAYLRRLDTANKDRYRYRALLEAGGDIVLRAQVDGTASTTSLGSNVTKTGLLVADTWYVIAFQAIGVSPTTLNGKLWKESDGEPAGWDTTVTDSTAALQVAGEPAMRCTVQSGVTSFPHTFTFADFMFSRVAAGRSHANGDAVVLVEPWEFPIAVAAVSGSPQSNPPTGALAINTNARPAELMLRAGNRWELQTPGFLSTVKWG